jgi:hypothetical protein
MEHAMRGVAALVIPLFFVLFAFVAFLINNVRGSRADRADKERIANAPKPPNRPLPKKLRDKRKR